MTRILVIDDEEILRDEVVTWLTLEDYEAQGAADGVEGVEVAFLNPPDLIVCDITMPKLDGYGVLLELHANPATADIPFIFVTARAALHDVRRGMDLGADDYITKPFTRPELLDAIQTRLKKKAVQQQHFQKDVEQWQQAFEHEREQSQLKAKLVSMFSHDFRNPLTAILSSHGLLRDYGDRMDEKRRQSHMNKIEASIQQLLQMLDDMLVVSQMESGNLEFKPGQLNIEEFLQQIIDEFQAINGESYSITLESRFSDHVMADPRLLRQIAANLISNAIKYSPQGSTVQVSLDRVERDYVIAVRDQGIGIPEADMARLFEAFHRASNVGDIRGTGLGLAIIKQAVDLHGGSIELESEVGKGTKIFVKLPIE